MKPTKNPEARARQFLLGQLSGQARREIEERLLRDDDFSEFLLMVEDELLEDYVRGALSPQERKACRDHFLQAPQHREKLRLARALLKYSERSAQAEPAEVKRPSWQAALAALSLPFRQAWRYSQPIALTLLVVAALGWGWSLTSLWRAREELGQFQAIPSYALDMGLQRTAPQNTEDIEIRAQSTIPGDTGTPAEVKVPAGALVVELRLRFGAHEYGQYQADLQNPAGETIMSQRRLQAQEAESAYFVVLQVPAQLLTRDNYTIRLYGIDVGGVPQNLGGYSFRSLPEPR